MMGFSLLIFMARLMACVESATLMMSLARMSICSSFTFWKYTICSLTCSPPNLRLSDGVEVKRVVVRKSLPIRLSGIWKNHSFFSLVTRKSPGRSTEGFSSAGFCGCSGCFFFLRLFLLSLFESLPFSSDFFVFFSLADCSVLSFSLRSLAEEGVAVSRRVAISRLKYLILMLGL